MEFFFLYFKGEGDDLFLGGGFRLLQPGFGRSRHVGCCLLRTLHFFPPLSPFNLFLSPKTPKTDLDLQQMILFDQYTKNCDMKKDEAKRLSINRFCRGSGMVPRAILNLGMGSLIHDTWLTRVLSSNMGPTKDKNRFVCYWIPSSPFGLLRSNYSVPIE